MKENLLLEFLMKLLAFGRSFKQRYKFYQVRGLLVYEYHTFGRSVYKRATSAGSVRTIANRLTVIIKALRREKITDCRSNYLDAGSFNIGIEL